MSFDISISASDWEAITTPLSEKAKRSLANWLAHDATAEPFADGVRIHSARWRDQNKRLFIFNDGSELFAPIDVNDPLCALKTREKEYTSYLHKPLN